MSINDLCSGFCTLALTSLHPNELVLSTSVTTMNCHPRATELFIKSSSPFTQMAELTRKRHRQTQSCLTSAPAAGTRLGDVITLCPRSLPTAWQSYPPAFQNLTSWLQHGCVHQPSPLSPRTWWVDCREGSPAWVTGFFYNEARLSRFNFAYLWPFGVT